MNYVNKSSNTREAKLLFGLIFASLLFSWVECDAAKDKEECTEQLAGLATCLAYVGGNAKSPTPDCCNGLKQVLKTNKKCLCVIVQDRNDPDLGLDINVTLALGLPSVCATPANITKCPELLHLPPNSAEAQVFYDFAKNSSNKATTPASSPVSGGTSNGTVVPATTGAPSMAQQKNDGTQIGKGWLKLRTITIYAFILCFTSIFSM